MESDSDDSSVEICFENGEIIEKAQELNLRSLSGTMITYPRAPSLINEDQQKRPTEQKLDVKYSTHANINTESTLHEHKTDVTANDITDQKSSDLDNVDTNSHQIGLDIRVCNSFREEEKDLDLTITEEERKWQSNMASRSTAIKENKERFENWKQSIHKKREELYEKRKQLTIRRMDRFK